MQSMISPDLGVVVIGRNEGERLAQCLASLEARSGKVVYVDSGSSDGSLETAGRFGALAHALGADRPFNAARARNAGARLLAQAFPNVVFIQFVDGDCIIAPDWLEKAQQFLLADPKAAVVCGRRRERFPGHSVYNRLMNLEWNTPIGQVASCGGDAMVRKEAFDSVGGFDETIVAGEEPEFCFRLRREGWTIWRIDAEMTQHDAALRRFSQWWKRSVRSGYGCAQLWDKHKGRVSPALSLQLARSVLWSLFVPLALLLSAAFSKWLLLLLAVYPAQILRMALRKRREISDPWAYAVIMTASHFAGFQGSCQYIWHIMTGRAPGQADYK